MMLLATTALALLPVLQEPQVVALNRLPSTIRLGQAVQAVVSIETQQTVGEPKLPKVDGLRLALGAPSSSRSMSWINGRQTIRASVEYPLEIRPLRLGKFEIPPIEVRVGDLVHRTKKRTIEVVKSVTGANLGSLTIVPSRQRVYVHEPIRFDIECTVSDELDLAAGRGPNGEKVYLVFLDAEWLGRTTWAEPMEVPETATDRTVNVVLNEHIQEADVASGTVGGKSRHVFQYAKAMLPTRPGKQSLAAPIMKFTVLAGARRDPFEIFPSRSQKEYFVYGEPIEIEVLPLPKEGRPTPFYGAVGRFQIDATVDKPIVKVGSSIKFVVTIAGEGNMEHLQVPELTSLKGLHQLGKTENRSKDRVVVTYDLVPKTVEVTELPSVNWNYFDTSEGAERFVEVATQPIPVTVKPLEGEEVLRELPGESAAAVEAGVDDIFDVKTDGPAVRVDPAPSRPVALIAALLPWAIGLLGMFFFRSRRRALADVAGRRARGAFKHMQRGLATGEDPVDVLVHYLADRLGCEPAAVIGPDLADRLRAVGVEDAQANAAQDLVDQGVAARYGGSASIDGARVEAMARELESQPQGPLPVGLLLAVALLAPATASAQGPSEAEKAYRARDFAAAEKGFRAAAEQGDRRAAYNLGNCLYRQGRYAAALAAYESARLGMPRDEELLANIRLVKERLDLGSAEGEPFLESLVAIRDSFTGVELFWMCLLFNAAAAGLCIFGGTRLRVVGVALAVPAVFLVLELAWLAPSRPPKAIVIEPKVELRAEPSTDVDALMRIRSGVAVEVLGSGESKWIQVRAEGRRGWLPRSAVVVIE